MRDDLLPAKAAVDWAVAQIEALQRDLIAWSSRRPYQDVREVDPNTGENLLVCYLTTPLDLSVNVEAGLIINSIRTSLDLLAASLARRNGKNANAETHFPIFDSHQSMIEPRKGIEGKKWLSETERAIIKSLKPYRGGDDAIWPLHQLDIRRKHDRLVKAIPSVAGALTVGKKRMRLTGALGIERLEDKTILRRSREPIDDLEGNTHIAAFVVFNEPEIGLVDQEVAETLLRFASRASEIISLFDTP